MSKAKKIKLLVCVRGKKCPKRGSKDVRKALKEAIAELGVEDKFKVKKTGCFGMCRVGPLVMVQPENVCYGYVTENDCLEIIESHLLEEEPVARLMMNESKK